MYYCQNQKTEKCSNKTVEVCTNFISSNLKQTKVLAGYFAANEDWRHCTTIIAANKQIFQIGNKRKYIIYFFISITIEKCEFYQHEYLFFSPPKLQSETWIEIYFLDRSLQCNTLNSWRFGEEDKMLRNCPLS